MLYYSYAQVSFHSKAGFFSQSKPGCADFESGYPSRLFWCSTTEIHWSRPLRFQGNAYLIASKVGMTRIYVNKNEEEPEGLPGSIFEE